MSRMILCEDDTSEGCVEYYYQKKKLYDKIIDYFNVKIKNYFNTSSKFDISTEFENDWMGFTIENNNLFL